MTKRKNNPNFVSNQNIDTLYTASIEENPVTFRKQSKDKQKSPKCENALA